MEYKDRIKTARKHARLTQAELAQKVGITQVSISDLERGKSVSSSYNASIAKACQVNALWLETEEGPMLPIPLSEAIRSTSLGGFEPAGGPIEEPEERVKTHSPARRYQDDLYESAPVEQRADVDDIAEKLLKLSPEQARKLKQAMDLLIPDDGSAKD